MCWNIKRNFKTGALFFTVAALILFKTSSCQGQENTDVKKMLLDFPVERLEELIQTINPDEFKQTLKTGSSNSWEIVETKNKPNSANIQNKRSPDNAVIFYKFKTSNPKWLFAVKQVNAQNQTTDLWLYDPLKTKNDWEKFNVTSLLIRDFVSEQVILPPELNLDSKAFLQPEFRDSVYFKINLFTFLKEVEKYFPNSSSALAHCYIKYKYTLGPDLILKKMQDEDYEMLPTLTAIVEKENPDGPGLTEFNCPHGVSVTASSELPSATALSYKASNVLDENNKTAWSEGMKGSGLGEWIEFTITSAFYIGESYQLQNGYVKDKTSWMNNNRVKKLKCFVNGKLLALILLNDVMDYQSFSIKPAWFKINNTFKKGDKIRFIIEEIYKGIKYDDTLLSHFVPTGNCG